MHRKASIEDNMRKKKITSIIMLAVAVILCLTGVGLLTLQGNLRLGKGDTLVIICGICYAK